MERECLNNLIQTDNGSDTEARIRRVVKMLLAGEYEDVPVGALVDGTPYRISEYNTQDANTLVPDPITNL